MKFVVLGRSALAMSMFTSVVISRYGFLDIISLLLSHSEVRQGDAEFWFFALFPHLLYSP